jgi:hypothetical protein
MDARESFLDWKNDHNIQLAPNRWQHRLNRERPTCTERNESLLESADGSMATAANGRRRKSFANNMKPEFP